MSAASYPAELAERESLPGEVVRFRIRPLDGSFPPFRAGQHAWVFLEGAAAAFSIASPPHDLPALEFCLRRSSHPFVAALDRAPAGATLRVSAPDGMFTPRPGASLRLFVGTGTGIAPLRSMLFEQWQSGAEIPSLLLQGDRGPEWPVYSRDFLRAAAVRPDFRYVVCLSTRSEDERTYTGRVTDFLRARGRDDLLDLARRAGLSGATGLAGAQAYLCGRPDMLEEVEALLPGLGISLERVFHERQG